MKRCIRLLVAVLMLTLVVIGLSQLTTQASAAVTASGICGANGDNATWELTDDGVLTISGTGPMANFTYIAVDGRSSAPWFGYRGSISTVVVENGVTTIGNYAFSNCSGITSVAIPESVSSIGNDAFYKCKSLILVTIPEGVTAIGERVFFGCSSLTDITIPASVTAIGDEAFYKCSKLSSVTILEGATSIGRYAFSDCTSLTSITIPASVRTIYGAAFEDCYNLTSVTIPASVISIGDYVFNGCSRLVSITIPETITSIGECMFDGCSSLTSVVIPENVTEIGRLAFARCSRLTSVTIPKSVTFINATAFYNCSSLSHVAYTGTQAQWNAAYMNWRIDSATRHYETTFVDVDNCVESGVYCPVCEEYIIRTAKDGGKHSYTDVYDLSCGVCDFSRTLTGISLSALPEKQGYFLFEELDVSGGMITVTYDDGSTGEIAMSSDMVAGFKPAAIGVQELTVSYNGFNATFTVEVKIPDYVMASVDGVYYEAFAEAMAAAGQGSVVQLHKDIDADVLVIGDGVTLDLNGRVLSVPGGVVSFAGYVTDSTDGIGLLVSGADRVILSPDNGQLPLYDTESAGYRFFNYRFDSLGAYTESKTNVAVFGMRLTLTNAQGYSLLANAGSGMTLKVKLSWQDMEGQAPEYSFGSDLMALYAEKIQTSSAYALLLRVSNAYGKTLTAEPSFVTLTRMGDAAEPITHTVKAPQQEPEDEPTVEKLTYLEYEALSAAQKQAYMEAAFDGDVKAFIQWYNEAKAEYEASTEPVPTYDGGDINIGDMIGKN